MTAKELLEQAKAVGGWYVNGHGQIRTRKKRDRFRMNCCPITAVLGGANGSAFYAAGAIGVTACDAIIAAADGHTYGKYRKEMESWCK